MYRHISRKKYVSLGTPLVALFSDATLLCRTVEEATWINLDMLEDNKNFRWWLLDNDIYLVVWNKVRTLYSIVLTYYEKDV